MNPLSPHAVPQEFLIFQYWSFDPTNKTPWLTLTPQFERTPDLYCPQTLASTATETGLPLKAFSRF
jgi:hypothetical protein